MDSEDKQIEDLKALVATLLTRVAELERALAADTSLRHRPTDYPRHTRRIGHALSRADVDDDCHLHEATTQCLRLS